MALYTTPDGRVVIGTGVSDGNDYHGYNGKRDIVIQLTADGATDDGLNALEYLKAYATNAKAENKPIFPDGTRVFISTNGYTKAVEADDVVIDGDDITIGGIAWNGSAWDYSGAGQVASSLPEVGADDNGKVLTVVDGEWAAANGGGSGVGDELVVGGTYGDNTLTLDKTWQEIYDARYPIIVIKDNDEGSVFWDVFNVTGASHFVGGKFIVNAKINDEPVDFIADTASGYPSATIG